MAGDRHPPLRAHGAISEGPAERETGTHRWLSVDVSSTAIGAWFEAEFGRGCKAKTFPGWMLGAPKTALAQVLEGFKLGRRMRP